MDVKFLPLRNLNKEIERINMTKNSHVIQQVKRGHGGQGVGRGCGGQGVERGRRGQEVEGGYGGQRVRKGQKDHEAGRGHGGQEAERDHEKEGQSAEKDTSLILIRRKVKIGTRRNRETGKRNLQKKNEEEKSTPNKEGTGST